MARHRSDSALVSIGAKRAVGIMLASMLAWLIQAGCTHQVDVEPIKVEPIHITFDINLKLQKEFQELFSASPGELTAGSEDGTVDPIMNDVARIKRRAEQIVALKDAGVLGETWRGLVEPAMETDDQGLAQLVAAENGDEEELFRLVAAENNTTVERVRRNFAVFRFDDSADHHYFKGRKGDWLTKGEWVERGYPKPFADGTSGATPAQ